MPLVTTAEQTPAEWLEDLFERRLAMLHDGNSTFWPGATVYVRPMISMINDAHWLSECRCCRCETPAFHDWPDGMRWSQDPAWPALRF